VKVASSVPPPEHRFDRSSWLALGFACLLSGYTAVVAVMMLLTPGDGWALNSHLVAGRLDEDQPISFQYHLTGAASPIMAGDELVAIEGLTVEQLADRAYAFYRNRPPTWDDGTVLRYTVRRDGHLLDLDVPLHRASLWSVGANLARQALAQLLTQTAASLFFFTVGAVVFVLRPRERAAQALLILGAGFLPFEWPDVTGSAFYPFPLPSTPLEPWMAAILPSIACLVLVFPRPRGPLRRFPRLSVLLLYVWATLAIDLTYVLNLDDRTTYVAVSTAVYAIGAVGTLALVVVGLIYDARTLRSPVERAQLGWMALGLLCFMLLGVGGWFAGFAFAIESAHLISLVGWFVLPVCLGIAITRYRLFDIEVVIRRTAVYGALTATLAAVYLAAVALAQSLVRAMTGQESDLAIVVATLAVAALFQPLRGRIQAFIDRRFHRHAYDADVVLAIHAAALRDEVDTDQVAVTLVGAVDGALRPAHVALWVRGPGDRP
jgi:hypothetical protein